MKSQLITDPGEASSRRLILLFAGWGMDSRPFSRLGVSGYDLMVVYDYTDPLAGLDVEALARYSEICVVAWSMGVSVASHFIKRYESTLPLTLTVAVNGTPWPADERRGIPPAIFFGTLEGLSERNLAKFNRRMTGSAAAYREWLEIAPTRDIPSLSAELAALGRLEPATDARWDVVYIGRDDHIVPTAAQTAAWASHPLVRYIDAPHLPPFAAILEATVVDKHLVTSRFKRSADTYLSTARVQRHIAARLGELMSAHVDIAGKRMIEIGSGTGLFTEIYLAQGTPASLELWDLTDAPTAVTLPADTRFTACDAEVEIRRVSDCWVDVIATSATVQWFNSLPAFLRQAVRKLRPGGILALSTFGPLTFRELAELTGRSLRYYSLESFADFLLPADATVAEACDEKLDIAFDNPVEMLRHIKCTGVNGMAHRSPVAAVNRILRSYPRDPQTHTVTLTYQPQYIILRKKDR